MSQAVVEVAGALRELAPEGYFVGGCVRDCLMGRPVKDIDVAMPGAPWQAARRLARERHGAAFWLREEDEVARVVLPGAGGLSVDFSPLRVPLEEDLAARDLTINAMAIPLAAGLCPEGAVIDPAGGRADLEARRIRFTRPDAIERDPLRALRALRFRWQLRFRLARSAREGIEAGAGLLARVSRERIRDELFLMLELPEAHRAVFDLIHYRLWPTIFPDAPSPALEGRRPAPVVSLRRVAEVLDQVNLTGSGPAARALLDEQPTRPRSRRSLLRLAALLMPLYLPGEREAPPDPQSRAGEGIAPEEVAGSLRLSAREGKLVRQALETAPRAVELAARWPAAGRERLRLFRLAGESAVEGMLLAGARVGWQGPLQKLLEEALRRREILQEPLLTGREIMELLGIPPGPPVGRLLAAVEEARADDVVVTPEGARAWLVENWRAL